MGNTCPQCGAALPTGALGGLCPACLLKQGAAAETSTQPETAPFQPPSVEEMARLFPQLEIQGFIGKGGMGAVYKARQPGLDRLVALKILPPQVASGPGFAERFNREARALAKLNHPNIVAVHEFGQVNGLPFFIMEFVDGVNLRQLERAGKLSPREALQIVPQICEALQFAHDEGIVHRDIKPENLLLDKKGRVKIADFGIAKIMGSEGEAGITETRGAIGTPQYMAPEQVEKPETVDHRADIFSLGVVFYEMLTGELPLGKFAPPSRKVNVDVRLDEVVLRSLEKEPERRYQYASQVKTAVDTIASTSPPPPRQDAQALAREILAQGSALDIGSCLRRGWGLVRSNFWPIVGVSALMVLLVQAANSTAVGIVAGGPLMGGLWLYLLNRARGEPASLDTAFSGFRIAFVNLFLGSLVTFVLTLIGFICLVLPGLYLAVAWMFALILVIDLRLDFWPAMELSRQVVTRHWWKFFGFWIVLLLMKVAGALACGVGLFFTAPIALAATVFAYEDIFGPARRKASEASARVGPSGTEVLPEASGKAPYPGGGAWKPVVAGLAAVALLLVLVAAISGHRARMRHAAEAWAAQQESAAQAGEASTDLVFGPVIERVLEFTNSNRRALNLASGDYVASTPERTLDFGPGGIDGLREAGVDLYLSDAALEAFSNKPALNENDFPQPNALDFRSVFSPMTDDSGAPVNNITNAAYSGGEDIIARLMERRAEEGGSWEHYESLAGTNVFRLVTRDGTRGLLQICGVTDQLRGVKVRYKLLNQTSPPGEGSNLSLQSLTERWDAACQIGNAGQRSQAFARLATDAAKAGEVDLVRTSLQRIVDNVTRDQATLDSVRLLARRHLRKPAIEIARTITGNQLRDRALSELAQ
ncbi:MAG TPA: protein kinase [Candidatus Acidoferrum sp.]|nr:protein kinase [Candidatus Acidoferrum sp.]